MSDSAHGPEHELAIHAPEVDSDQLVDWVANRLIRMGREKGRRRRRRLKLVVIGSLVLLVATAGMLLWWLDLLEELSQWLGFFWGTQ